MRYSPELENMVIDLAEKAEIPEPEDIPKQLNIMLKNYPMRPRYKRLLRKLMAIGLKAIQDNQDGGRSNPFLKLTSNEIKRLKIPKLRLK